jgi:hypothetical protein
MKPEDEQELQRLIGGELKKLGERTAPATLIPRVLSSIEAQSVRRWHQKSWSDWPPVVQVISMILMLGASLAAVAAFPSLWGALMPEDGASRLEGIVEMALGLGNAMAALGNAFLLLASSLQPWLMAGLFLTLLMYLAVVGLGTFCARLALHSTPSIHEN